MRRDLTRIQKKYANPVDTKINPGVPMQVIRKFKIGRNDPCYCMSGKKYKRCHGT